MNTDSNTATTTAQPMSRQIISSLDSCSIHMPLSRMMQELQVIIERLTFGSTSLGGDIKDTDIDSLIGTDVSPEMMVFVRWMHRYNLINLLVGKNGQQFLVFCARYYKSIREITCTLPIAASDAFQRRMITHLRAIYPEPARIIFDTAPSIMAGVVINDGQKETDMSLAGKSPALISRYMTGLATLKQKQIEEQRQRRAAVGASSGR